MSPFLTPWTWSFFFLLAIFRKVFLNTFEFCKFNLVQSSHGCSGSEAFLPLIWKQLLLRDIHKADEMVSLQTKGLQRDHSQAESLCTMLTIEKKYTLKKRNRKSSNFSPDFEKNKFKSFSCYELSRQLWANFSASAIAPPPWSGGQKTKRADKVKNSRSHIVLLQPQLPAFTGPKVKTQFQPFPFYYTLIFFLSDSAKTSVCV